MGNLDNIRDDLAEGPLSGQPDIQWLTREVRLLADYVAELECRIESTKGK